MCNVDSMKIARTPLPIQSPYDRIRLNVNKVIDDLHMRNHKRLECREKYSTESVRESCPLLNTPVAEQTFTWAARFKQIICARPECREKYSTESVRESCPGLNTPVAEQTFTWAARFKKIICAMPQRHAFFYYHRMVTRGTGTHQDVTKTNVRPIYQKLEARKQLNHVGIKWAYAHVLKTRFLFQTAFLHTFQQIQLN